MKTKPKKILKKLSDFFEPADIKARREELESEIKLLKVLRNKKEE